MTMCAAKPGQVGARRLCESPRDGSLQRQGGEAHGATGPRGRRGGGGGGGGKCVGPHEHLNPALRGVVLGQGWMNAVDELRRHQLVNAARGGRGRHVLKERHVAGPAAQHRMHADGLPRALRKQARCRRRGALYQHLSQGSTEGGGGGTKAAVQHHQRLGAKACGHPQAP
jgi:hypothetical protein